MVLTVLSDELIKNLFAFKRARISKDVEFYTIEPNLLVNLQKLGMRGNKVARALLTFGYFIRFYLPDALLIFLAKESTRPFNAFSSLITVSSSGLLEIR